METVYSVPKNEEYSREELDSKKMNELKEILKNKNLKISGKKEELIDRILRSQLPIEIDKTYFNLLPLDVQSEINELRNKEGNIALFIYILNKQIEKVNYLLEGKEIDGWLFESMGFKSKRDFIKHQLGELNKFFKKTGLPINVYFEDIIKTNKSKNIILIDDKILIKFIYLLMPVNMGKSIYLDRTPKTAEPAWPELNDLFEEFNSDLRIVQTSENVSIYKVIDPLS